VIRTRVGYAGGTTPNPTYARIGDHSETIQIDYDPAQISYPDLLAVFWDSHDPSSRPYSRQYMSIIFAHDEEQRRLAEASRDQVASERGRTLYTEIVPYTDFTLAEDYHQKYRLRHASQVMKAFRELYPDPSDLVNSTAAARVNGYVSGHGTLEGVAAALKGLPPEAQNHLLDLLEALRR
jgi:peptide-methionine (S)-S-oxide reductase